VALTISEEIGLDATSGLGCAKSAETYPLYAQSYHKGGLGGTTFYIEMLTTVACTINYVELWHWIFQLTNSFFGELKK
jgi:hypothetical protein